jgi:hypothetical protein
MRVLEERRASLRALGARRLGLFGSTARDEAGPTSDLDFVVELDERTFDRYMDLKLFLEELFGCRWRRPPRERASLLRTRTGLVPVLRVP